MCSRATRSGAACGMQATPFVSLRSRTSSPWFASMGWTSIPSPALTRQMMTIQRGQGLNLLHMYRGIMRTFGAIADSYAQALGADALRNSDAILSQLPGGFHAYDLAEALRVPFIALSVIPQEITGAWPLSLLRGTFSLGPAYNRLTYRLGQQLAWHPFRR